jgi:hypothetical protein
LSRRRAVIPAAAALAVAGLTLAGLPSTASVLPSAHLSRSVEGGDGGGFPGAEVALGDADRRGAALAPLASAKQQLARLGKGLQVSWTQYGTPLSLTRESAMLATGLVGGTPEQVARGYLRTHAALWGLSAADVDALKVVINEPLPESTDAYSVSFQQYVGGLSLAEDGYVVVGVKGDSVAIVTSSLVPSTLLTGLRSTTPKLSAARAVLAAAKDAGVTNLGLGDLKIGKVDHAGFTQVTTSKLHQPQRTRVRVLPTTTKGPRLVWETDVLDVAGGRALATISFVDADNGKVLLRRDAVDTLFDGDDAPLSAAQDGKVFGPATWRVFGSNPALARVNDQSKDDRYLACSGSPKPAMNPLMKSLYGCSFLYNDGSPLAYDVDPIAGVPTFTTIGNNAVTTNAQASTSLTPGAPVTPYVSPTRDYAPVFDDAWHTELCNPAVILPPRGANIDAAMVNLFIGHNRMHDFSYRLGLNEVRGAMQVSNFGKTAAGSEADPELGNAQNGALQGGNGLGRDNANQITLQDGVPGITNQYLFQPVIGFASPCTDGDLDGAVFIHEYTHAISNRLIAGPATGLSGHQGGSMGESWSDLVALEYLNAFGLAGGRGEHPYSMGAYVTGNAFRGIRDYNAAPENNPLNYSDVGFDATGPEVHADGEIWNAIQMTVREALIIKWNKRFKYNNRTLQIACAVGRYANGKPAPKWNKCPGNRRYVTYLFDAMILQANGAPSMVDMKNAELAAILMRDKGDYKMVADAFASRGLGKSAESHGSGDTDPTPGFDSIDPRNNGTVTFDLRDANTGKKVAGDVFVGVYHARCMPIASTVNPDEADATPTAKLMKGTYDLTIRAEGYGIQRVTMAVGAGKAKRTIKLARNVASAAFGAAIRGNGGAARLGNVIDDDETTNGAFVGQPVKGRTITVTLAGGHQKVDSFAVSALHHPAKNLPEGGTEVEGRLSGINDFELQVSNDGGQTFRTVYRSPDDFFPVGRPRAVAPDLILRTVKLPHAVTANVVRLVIRSNSCTGTAGLRVEQDNDPSSPSDCTTPWPDPTAADPENPDSTDPVDFTDEVTVAELQVFKAR